MRNKKMKVWTKARLKETGIEDFIVSMLKERSRKLKPTSRLNIRIMDAVKFVKNLKKGGMSDDKTDKV